jgi:hypothetical protein
LLLTTRETVAYDTPASRATSRIVTARAFNAKPRASTFDRSSQDALGEVTL